MNLALYTLDIRKPRPLPSQLPVMAKHHMAVASRKLDYSPSAASSADAPSVVVVDVARNSAVVAFA